jgi:hypothetical protein
VVLNRVDGHAIDIVKCWLWPILLRTLKCGGQIEIGEPTGILIDNPMELVFSIIRSQTKTQIAALLDAEKLCLIMV